MVDTRITTTALLAEASRQLDSGGYRRVELSSQYHWPTRFARVFEDPYSIVSVLVYETFDELERTWPEAQATLTELISANVRRGEPKAWDGYLALFTPSSPTSEPAVDDIRYNVSRLRKLVGTSLDLLELGDVRRILLPLLPLEADLSETHATPAMDMIPQLLSAKGTPEHIARALVDAFQRQKPLVESLHRERTEE